MIYPQRCKAREGFTLIEILIAVTIVIIMGVVVAPNFRKWLGFSADAATKANLRTLSTTIDQFYIDMGDYPDKLRDLVKKPANEKFAKKWTESYLKQKDVPMDGWKHSFQYKKPGEQGHPYELYSYGKNGKGAPKSEWISVWDL